MARPKSLAFTVPGLGAASTQSEEVLQLLLFAASRLEQEIDECARGAPTVHLISVDGTTDGWDRWSELFSDRARPHVRIEKLEDPETPNLAIASHKPAYNLYEFLKSRSFNEIHSLDTRGLLYYPTQAKRLGLNFLETLFAVHVVGGTVFFREVEDLLLDDIEPLMDDLLERGSVERADVVYVHDRKAWHWYQDKVDTDAVPNQEVHDLSWPSERSPRASLEKNGGHEPLAIVYHGRLGSADGLPLFCDMIDRTVSRMKTPIHVFFVGTPRPVGAMDAVSYIRLRSARWRVPVTLKRDLAIVEEVDFVAALAGIVFCHTLRREGLRSRLLVGGGVRCLGVFDESAPPTGFHGEMCAANPDELAQAVERMVATPRRGLERGDSGLTDLWGSVRGRLRGHAGPGAEPPLKLDRGRGPKVSVCITHYNRPSLLRRALNSLRNQTYKTFEVIVVDDGTSNPSAMRDLTAIEVEIKELGWRLFLQPNRYLGAARNVAARHATGEYLLFMDDDNVAKPHELETFVAVAQRTRADIVTSFCDVFRNEKQLDNGPPQLRFTPFGSDSALGALSNCYGDANALYARTAFDELGGFTEDYGITHEDWELFCKASLAGMKMVCVPEALFWYRMDRDGMFRGERTQLHKSANLRRHIRPFLEKLPYYQAKLVQLAQGLTTQLPMTTVGALTRTMGHRLAKSGEDSVPFARVAVITRTKDRPLLLRRAIRSVLDQTYKDWVLVVVNDGGHPECCELVVEEFREQLGDRLLLIHHPVSLGMQVASNQGISQCDSDFIVIHDDDDSWLSTFLARMVSNLDESSHRFGGVVCWSQIVVEELDENGEMIERSRFLHNDRLEDISILDLAVENRFPPIAFLFRRPAYDAVGVFDERYGVLGDWEFNLRLLRQFEIGVIPEALANYHHRSTTTTGDYGNSVHADNRVHRAKRVELLNHVVREGRLNEPLSQALALGDLRAEQERQFKSLRDNVGTLDEFLKQNISQMGRDIGSLGKSLGVKLAEELNLSQTIGRQSLTKNGRNLFHNGDFRLWPQKTKSQISKDGDFRVTELYPRLFLIYDGKKASCRVDRLKWKDNGNLIPYGKTYLHVENDHAVEKGSYLVLSYVLPSVLLVAGNKLCISGLSRLRSAREWIHIGGRYDLGSGDRFEWRDQGVSVTESTQRWMCVMDCPHVDPSVIALGHSASVMIKLPHDQRFSFDLTNLQIEIGEQPTEFEYL